MKPTQYQRCGKRIKNLETGEITGYKFVNEAKRESARLQREGGGLGCGILRKVPKL